MIDKQEVLKSLQEKIWSSLAVNAVIAEKVEKRSQRGENLLMYSLEIQPRSHEEKFNMENINKFVGILHQQALTSPKPIRLQLAVKTSNVHWTAMDIEVSKEGVKCINIDAVADPSSLGAKKIFDTLMEKYQDSVPQKSKFYFLRDSSLPSDETKKQGIQYDSSSCSRFALDILFHLATMDTFTIMENREQEMREKHNPFKTPITSPHDRFFNASNMPPEFACIYRGTQSKESFASLPEMLHQHEVNKKGETLSIAEAKHTKSVELKEGTKLRNLAIDYKRDGFIQDVQHAIDYQTNFLGKIQGRDVLTAIDNGSLASQRKFNQADVTSKLINEVHSIKEHKTMSGLSGVYHRFVDEYHFSESGKALKRGSSQDAIDHLTAMRSLNANYKHRLEEIKKEFQEEEDEKLSQGLNS